MLSFAQLIWKVKRGKQTWQDLCPIEGEVDKICLPVAPLLFARISEVEPSHH